MIGLQPILARQPTDFTAEFCERILPVQAHIRHARDVTDDRQSCSLAIEFKPKSGWRPLDSATSRRIGTTWSNACRNTASHMTAIWSRPGWFSRSRSEEHTSELQSLMRISYAVFCLQKTTIAVQNNQPPTRIHKHSQH